MKDRESILTNRWIRPFAHLFGHPSLWHFNRRSVPRGLAIGLFVGFVLPLGQFIVAALIAIPLRANVPLAAASTLVSNPLTFPPIYVAAFKVGDYLLRRPTPISDEAQDVATDLGRMLLDVSGPTALGLLVFAITASLVGYAGAALWWRIRLVRRWRARRGT